MSLSNVGQLQVVCPTPAIWVPLWVTWEAPTVWHVCGTRGGPPGLMLLCDVVTPPTWAAGRLKVLSNCANEIQFLVS